MGNGLADQFYVVPFNLANRLLASIKSKSGDIFGSTILYGTS